MVKLFLAFLLFISLILVNLIAVGVRAAAQGSYWAAWMTLMQIIVDMGGAVVLLVGVGIWLDRTWLRPSQRLLGVLRPQVRRPVPRSGAYEYEESPFNQPFQDNGWRRVSKDHAPICKMRTGTGWQLQDASPPVNEQPPPSNGQGVQNLRRTRERQNLYRPR